MKNFNINGTVLDLRNMSRQMKQTIQRNYEKYNTFISYNINIASFESTIKIGTVCTSVTTINDEDALNYIKVFSVNRDFLGDNITRIANDLIHNEVAKFVPARVGKVTGKNKIRGKEEYNDITVTFEFEYFRYEK